MRLKHLLSVFLTLLTLSVGQMWGGYSSNFTNKDLGVGTGELTWTASPEFNSFESSNSARGAQSSKASTNITITSANISGIVTKIEVVGSMNGAGSMNAKVGGSAFGSSESIAKGDNKKTYTFNGNATITNKAVEIIVSRSASATFWVKSITITTSSGSTYSIAYEDTNGEGDNGSYSASSTSSITSGTTITLSATPASCYELNAWDVYKTGTPATKVSVTNNQFTMPAYNVTVGASFQEKAAGKTVNFDAGPGISAETSLTETCEGSGVTLPNVTATGVCKGWTTFAGWVTSAVVDSTTTAVSLCTNPYVPSTNNQTLFAVYSKNKTGSNISVSDDITRATTGLASSGTGGYTNWSNKTVTSSAVYAGRGNKGVNYIQIKNGDNAGVVSTTSGGKLKKVTITWNTNTDAERYVTIYGKTTAYSGSSDLYDNTKKGTSLGTIIKGTSTELNVTGTYNYVGILASAAVYIDKITVTWETAGPLTTYYCSDPNCCTPLGSINGSFS